MRLANFAAKLTSPKHCTPVGVFQLDFLAMWQICVKKFRYFSCRN